MVCCSPEPRRVDTSYSGLNQKCYQPSDCHCGYEWMHKQGTASKLQRACTMPRSGPPPFSILDGCRQMLAIALQRAKGRDGGKKQFVGQRQKLLFEMESELAEELFQDFQGSHSIAFPRQRRRHMSQCPLLKTRCAPAQTKL